MVQFDAQVLRHHLQSRLVYRLEKVETVSICNAREDYQRFATGEQYSGGILRRNSGGEGGRLLLAVVQTAGNLKLGPYVLDGLDSMIIVEACKFRSSRRLAYFIE